MVQSMMDRIKKITECSAKLLRLKAEVDAIEETMAALLNGAVPEKRRASTRRVECPEGKNVKASVMALIARAKEPFTANDVSVQLFSEGFRNINSGTVSALLQLFKKQNAVKTVLPGKFMRVEVEQPVVGTWFQKQQ